MDSVTQFALGASIGEAVLGKKVGNRAPVIGGVIATLPDLDSFIPWEDAVASFTYHRSATHSLLVLAAVTPLLWWLLLKLQPAFQEYQKRAFWLVFLVLITHPLLDAFTVYGTQLFWPITDYPVSGSTIFIIDPAYTLWLLIGFISALVCSRQSLFGHHLNTAGIVLSSLYLGWTVAAKTVVDRNTEVILAQQGIPYERLMSTPAPFSTLEWRIIGRDNSGYFDSYYSVFGDNSNMPVNYYPSEDSLLMKLESHWPVSRLQMFTHGFYRVTRSGGDVVVTDLRMGLEGSYVFQFKVAESTADGFIPVISRQVP